jgi:hypothetical protein
MKKVFLLAMSALLVTGATFAEGTQKKACCKKSGKSCCKKHKAKPTVKEQTTKN